MKKQHGLNYKAIIKQLTWPAAANEYFIFLFCFAIMMGPAMTIMDSFPYQELSPDIKTYLGLAEFDFEQSPVRRYRIIVPFLAAIVNEVLGGFFNLVKPWNFGGPDFSLGFSFLLVNTTLLSVAGLILHKTLKLLQIKAMACFFGLLCFLTCRWTAYLAGLPWVDSLYFLIVVMIVHGLVSENHFMVAMACLIGPLAKESFLLFLPLIAWYSKDRWINKAAFILAGLLLAAGLRFWIDDLNTFSTSCVIQQDVNHLWQVPEGIRRLLSFHGLYEFLSIPGLFGLVLVSIVVKSARNAVLAKLPVFSVFFISIVILHALLSNDLARMYYLLLPLWCLASASALDWLMEKYSMVSEKEV